MQTIALIWEVKPQKQQDNNGMSKRPSVK